jgi:dTDP-L-rhamnose 4-epimerase
MRVLVTGGAGFIGSWLVESLLAADHTVTVVDNLSPQIHGAMPAPQLSWLDDARVQFVRGDVRDIDVMDKALAQVDAVVHLAAETGTGQSMYQIRHYYDVNVQATAALLELIGTRHRHVTKIVLASSRSVYGEGAYRLGDQLVVPQPRNAAALSAGQWEPTGPQGEVLELIATPESAPPQPASVYAATKLANEQLGKVFAEAYGTSVFALRFQNVYGERQSLRNPYTGILSIFSNRMRENLPINLFEDGLESRDFVHVSDVTRAIGMALAAARTGYEVLNVGSGAATSVVAVANHLREALGSRSELKVSGDFRAGDIRHCYADLTLARRAFAFEPSVMIEDGLRRFCAWVCTQDIVEDRSAQAMNELTRLGLGRAGAAA